MLFKNQEKIIENGQTSELKLIRKDVLEILNAAVEAVDPYNAVKSRLGAEIDVANFENIFLVGFGKASVGMAQAVVDSIDIKFGAIVTNDPNSKVKSNNV